jgi:uncharacterized membrane protein YphA (DoxX/SURF4 family)
MEEAPPESRRWLTESRAIGAVRASVGVILLWFGFLKFFPGLSPAEALASNTLKVLSCGALCPRTSVFLLATFESALGLLWLSGLWTRWAVLLLWLHMSGTALPVLLFPSETFTRFPYAPTFEGQYILKNIVIVCASLVVWTYERRRRRGLGRVG